MKLKRWYVNDHWRVIYILGRRRTGKDVLIRDLIERKGLLDAYSMFFKDYMKDMANMCLILTNPLKRK